MSSVFDIFPNIIDKLPNYMYIESVYIQLKPVNKNLPGILIELKAAKNCSEEQLKKLSQTALQQITDKKYDTEMTTEGVKTIYKYGVAFSGKNVEITVG